jgi:type II secretory pathway predicted ATPase ExeA
VFYGRNAETRRLAERLRAPAPRGAGLLAVVGPSGCGKSSLVRAGLCPLLDADPGWVVVPPLVPGADPAGALARRLAAAGRGRGLGWTAASVGAAFERAGGLGGLAAELAAAAPPAGRVLVVVDQAEELLTRADQAGRRRFAALLGGDADGLVRAVATVRSEFLDQVATLAREAGLQVETFCCHRWSGTCSRRSSRARPAKPGSRSTASW